MAALGDLERNVRSNDIWTRGLVPPPFLQVPSPSVPPDTGRHGLTFSTAPADIKLPRVARTSAANSEADDSRWSSLSPSPCRRIAEGFGGTTEEPSISGRRREPLASVASFDIVFDLVPIRYIANATRTRARVWKCMTLRDAKNSIAAENIFERNIAGIKL